MTTDDTPGRSPPASGDAPYDVGESPVGRTGGEEFVAILPGAPAGNAAEAAERVRRAVEQARFDEVHPTLSVSVSVGATVWHPRDGSFAATWKRADEQLYRAKAAGRNRVELDGALS